LIPFFARSARLINGPKRISKGLESINKMIEPQISRREPHLPGFLRDDLSDPLPLFFGENFAGPKPFLKGLNEGRNPIVAGPG
jgi:hypothetical protein